MPIFSNSSLIISASQGALTSARAPSAPLHQRYTCMARAPHLQHICLPVHHLHLCPPARTPSAPTRARAPTCIHALHSTSHPLTVTSLCSYANCGVQCVDAGGCTSGPSSPSPITQASPSVTTSGDQSRCLLT